MAITARSEGHRVLYHCKRAANPSRLGRSDQVEAVTTNRNRRSRSAGMTGHGRLEYPEIARLRDSTCKRSGS
jgi:hypothetical protein